MRRRMKRRYGKPKAACWGTKRARDRTLRSNQPRREFVGVEEDGKGVETMVGTTLDGVVGVVVVGQVLVVVQSVLGGLGHVPNCSQVQVLVTVQGLGQVLVAVQST